MEEKKKLLDRMLGRIKERKEARKGTLVNRQTLEDVIERMVDVHDGRQGTLISREYEEGRQRVKGIIEEVQRRLPENRRLGRGQLEGDLSDLDEVQRRVIIDTLAESEYPVLPGHRKERVKPARRRLRGRKR